MIAAGDPITVFAHVHYPEIWQGMSVLLEERLSHPFHLVLTSSLSRDRLATPNTDALISVRFLPVENRGRDILPFLQALGATPDFEFGLKLHTKKSPQREDGALWRGALLDSLLPSQGASVILTHLRDDERVGLVAPSGFSLSVQPWLLQNASGVHRVMAALGGADANDAAKQDAFFAAGSMFWFRRAALAELAQPRIQDLFEPELGQLDGTIAHAMERVFPIEARRQGFVSLAVTALLQSRKSMSFDDLVALAREHADIPSRYFPAPYVSALPLLAAQGSSRGAGHVLAKIYRARVPAVFRRIIRKMLGE